MSYVVRPSSSASDACTSATNWAPDSASPYGRSQPAYSKPASCSVGPPLAWITPSSVMFMLTCSSPIARSSPDVVAVHRSPLPVLHLSHGARQGQGQASGCGAGAAHAELDLLVHLAGQAPRLVLGPHEVGLLGHALRYAVPGQGRCVSEHADGAGEEEHLPMGDVHPRSLRGWRSGAPALPDGCVPAVGGGGEAGERHERLADGVEAYVVIRRTECDAHVRREARRAVPHKVPPVDLSPQQPTGRIRVRGGPYLRHPRHGATLGVGAAL